jgi:hypothetical protein
MVEHLVRVRARLSSFLVLTTFCVAQLFNTDVVIISSNDLNPSNPLVRFLEYVYDLRGSAVDL